MTRHRATLLTAAAALCGTAAALAALQSTGDARGFEQLRALTVVLLAVPALLAAAWCAASPAETGLAAACCTALYFFSPFIAARIESLIAPVNAASFANPHLIYFYSLITLHLVGSLLLIAWRHTVRAAAAHVPGEPA